MKQKIPRCTSGDIFCLKSALPFGSYWVSRNTGKNRCQYLVELFTINLTKFGIEKTGKDDGRFNKGQ
jgi:hypothetical protein